MYYFYLKHIFRQTVTEVNEKNYSSLKDMEDGPVRQYDQETAVEWNAHTPYISKILKQTLNDYKPTFTLHRHFQGRAPNFYEDQIIFGAFGFYFILNLIQTTGFTFVLWITILFLKHVTYIVNEYNGYFLFFVIPFAILYFVLFLIVIGITFKWFTLVASVIFIFLFIFRLR